MATYLILNLMVLAVAMVVLWRGIRTTRIKLTFVTLIVLFILTAVFDNVIVGLGIVGYDDMKILGIRLGTAPIEDFFYALAAGVIVPALWKRGHDG